MTSAQDAVTAAGYKIVSRADFDTADDVPPRLRLIADRVFKRWGGDFVVYDPAGGDDGWLIIDDDRDQVIGETMEHLGRQQPDEPKPAQASMF